MFQASIKPPGVAVVRAGPGPVMLPAPVSAVVIQEQRSVRAGSATRLREESVVAGGCPCSRAPSGGKHEREAMPGTVTRGRAVRTDAAEGRCRRTRAARHRRS